MMKLIGWAFAVFALVGWLAVANTANKKIAVEQTIVDEDLARKKSRSDNQLAEHAEGAEQNEATAAEKVAETARLEEEKTALEAAKTAATARINELEALRDKLIGEKDALRDNKIQTKQARDTMNRKIAHQQQTITNLNRAIGTVTPKQ